MWSLEAIVHYEKPQFYSAQVRVKLQALPTFQNQSLDTLYCQKYWVTPF